MIFTKWFNNINSNNNLCVFFEISFIQFIFVYTLGNFFLEKKQNAKMHILILVYIYARRIVYKLVKDRPLHINIHSSFTEYDFKDKKYRTEYYTEPEL